LQKLEAGCSVEKPSLFPTFGDGFGEQVDTAIVSSVDATGYIRCAKEGCLDDILQFSTVKDTQMELWQPVVNFEPLYHISNLGNVKSIRPLGEFQRTLSPDQILEIHQLSKTGISARKIAPLFHISQTIISKILRGAAYNDATHILTPALRRDGYLFVTLVKNAENSHKTIHSMVAASFIGNRPIGRYVNHIDGNKQNNVAKNLEYISQRGNMQHALYELGKSKKLTFEQARDIWYAKQTGERRKEIAVKHGVSIHMVTAIWMGKSWWHAR
jgi:hypothetical protein